MRYGGHTGYGICYAEWNKGLWDTHASIGLDRATNFGISRVLITCADDNVGSARVMEKNGFSLQDKIHNVIDGKNVLTRRYIKNISTSVTNLSILIVAND